MSWLMKLFKKMDLDYTDGYLLLLGKRYHDVFRLYVGVYDFAHVGECEATEYLFCDRFHCANLHDFPLL